MPAPLTHNTSTAPAIMWKQYAAGGPYDLIAGGPSGSQACRKIVLLAAGDLTACVAADGVTNRPITGAPAGFQHVAQCSSITPSVACVVYW